MQAAPSAIEDAARDGEQSHHEGVKPNQRIENEVRAQPAQPAMSESGNSMRAWPERGEGNGLRRGTFQGSAFDGAAFNLVDR